MPSTRRLNKNQLQSTIFFIFHLLPPVTIVYHPLPHVTIVYHKLPLVSPPITTHYYWLPTHYHQFNKKRNHFILTPLYKKMVCYIYIHVSDLLQKSLAVFLLSCFMFFYKMFLQCVQENQWAW